MFIAILERSQGDSLRRFSNAAQNIIDPLIHDNLPSEPFEIEKRLPAQILGLPKCSDALLEQVE